MSIIFVGFFHILLPISKKSINSKQKYADDSGVTFQHKDAQLNID